MRWGLPALPSVTQSATWSAIWACACSTEPPAVCRPTPQGERLIARILPLMGALDEALADLAPTTERLRGILRINGNEPGVRLLLSTVVPDFLKRYPQVELDLVTDGTLIDIVEHGFDAGVRLHDAVPKDMIAIPLQPWIRFLTVAAPDYLLGRPEIDDPHALSEHLCIRQRFPSGKRFRWEFTRGDKYLALDVPGQLTLDNSALMVEAAIAGLGIAYVPEPYAAAAIEDGRLVAVLPQWCPTEPGLALYYAGHRHVPAPLRAFIDMLKGTSEPPMPKV